MVIDLSAPVELIVLAVKETAARFRPLRGDQVITLRAGMIWKAVPGENRPYLRCMHGYGLCLWRLRRFEEAERVFERMLWLNPSDNQGARFLIDQARAKIAWDDREKD